MSGEGKGRDTDGSLLFQPAVEINETQVLPVGVQDQNYRAGGRADFGGFVLQLGERGIVIVILIAHLPGGIAERPLSWELKPAGGLQAIFAGIRRRRWP